MLQTAFNSAEHRNMRMYLQASAYAPCPLQPSQTPPLPWRCPQPSAPTKALATYPQSIPSRARQHRALELCWCNAAGMVVNEHILRRRSTACMLVLEDKHAGACIPCKQQQPAQTGAALAPTQRRTAWQRLKGGISARLLCTACRLQLSWHYYQDYRLWRWSTTQNALYACCRRKLLLSPVRCSNNTGVCLTCDCSFRVLLLTRR